MPQRPMMPPNMINIQELHQRSMEEDRESDTDSDTSDDSDNVNRSMRQLAVNDTPPQAVRLLLTTGD